MGKNVNLFVLGAIIVISLVILVRVARSDSAVTDELAHVAAGYSYVTEKSLLLNPEHPPLLKAMSGLLLLSQQPNFSTDEVWWKEKVNGQWGAGLHFLYQNENDADRILFWGRLAPIIITVFTVIIVYIWSRLLVGAYWALLPATFTAFSPTFLAHGHYITTDVAAAFGMLLAVFLLVQVVKRPSPSRTLLAALGFGIAQAMKFSSLFLIPFFLFLLILVIATASDKLKAFKIYSLRFLFVIIGGYALVIYPLYGVLIQNYPPDRQYNDTQSILHEITDPDKAGELDKTIENIFLKATQSPWLRPLSHYALGAYMVSNRYNEGNMTYFLGRITPEGSRAYFPLLFATKTPVPTLLLVAGALGAAIVYLKRYLTNNRVSLASLKQHIRFNFSLYTLLFFVLAYWFVSILSPLNLGIRHILPVLAPMFMLAIVFWKKYSQLPYKVYLLALLTGSLIFTSIQTYPYYLSFYNSPAGGTARGYQVAVDSNYDWGQDLRRFKDWLQDHPEIDSIAVNYGGDVAAKYYLDERAVDWSAAKGNPQKQDIKWLAVSISVLQRLTQPVTQPDLIEQEEDYSWLLQTQSARDGAGEVPQPYQRIGTSVFLYRL